MNVINILSEYKDKSENITTKSYTKATNLTIDTSKTIKELKELSRSEINFDSNLFEVTKEEIEIKGKTLEDTTPLKDLSLKNFWYHIVYKDK